MGPFRAGKISISTIKSASALLIILAPVFFYQNCSDVSLSDVRLQKIASCAPSVYDISREAQTINGYTIYFLRQNNHEISHEYQGNIQWIVNDQIQEEPLIHENRLLLDCASHPEVANIEAVFISDCGEEKRISYDAQAPSNCEPQSEPPSETYANYCEEYKASLGPIGSPRRDYFEAYNAENRGFKKVETTFQNKTGRILGESTGAIQGALPGQLKNDEFLALSFLTENAGANNSGKFRIQPSIGYTISNHPILITISPCPGDFRPPSEDGDHYTVSYPFCRTGDLSLSPQPLYGSSNTSDIGYCQLPIRKKMYINISTRDMYLPGDISQIPESDCSPMSNCGLIFALGK